MFNEFSMNFHEMDLSTKRRQKSGPSSRSNLARACLAEKLREPPILGLGVAPTCKQFRHHVVSSYAYFQ